MLGAVKQSSYAHVTHIDTAAGVYDVDCSGLVDYVLKQTAPKALYRDRKATVAQTAPLADDYYSTFENAAATPASCVAARLTHVNEAHPGDILCWKDPTHKLGEHTNTGHVMIIDEAPVEEARDEETIIGNLRSWSSIQPPRRTRRDSRQPDTGGVGRGTLWIDTDASGAPTGYRWKSATGMVHENPIAIGRAVEP